MNKIDFQCVDCGREIGPTAALKVTCPHCSKTYTLQQGVWQAWPTTMSKLAQEEAEYHDHFDENATEVHQLNAWRNFFYHRLLWQVIRALPSGSRLLEIGAGGGFDADNLKGYNLVLSDISAKTLERLQQKMKRPDITYVACDGSKLPFSSASFAGLYTIATWHHFHEPKQALAEMNRVLKPHGLLVIGVEPNRLYFRWMKKFRSGLCAATHGHEHEGSHADAEMEGFSYKGLKQLFVNEDWYQVQIQPMWFLAGWLHYGLEFLYRVFKLKKRITIPKFLEKGVVAVDELFFKIPFLNRIGWHWIIIARKK